MSCRSSWSGPEVSTEMETLLIKSIERAERKTSAETKAPWSIGVPAIPAARVAPAIAEPAGLAEVLSPSQVNGFLDCSAAWKYRYVDKLESPATLKQARGTAVHGLIAYYMRERLAGREPIAEQLADAYSEMWDSASDGAVYGPKDDVEAFKRTGAELAGKYIAERASQITPAATELFVSGEISGVKVRGYVDVLCQDDSGKIIDVKTSSRKPSSVSSNHALQLATYARLTPGATGLVQIDTLVATKQPQLVSIEYQVPEADVRLIDTIYPAVQKSMRSGIYLPNRGSLFCSRSNCAFADACTAEFGGVVE